MEECRSQSKSNIPEIALADSLNPSSSYQGEARIRTDPQNMNKETTGLDGFSLHLSARPYWEMENIMSEAKRCVSTWFQTCEVDVKPPRYGNTGKTPAVSVTATKTSSAARL